MVYSLVVVQHRVARFFHDDDQREEFLLVLSNVIRWPVAGLLLSGRGDAFTRFGAVSVGFTLAVGLDPVAAGILVDVPRRNLPARIFVLPKDIPRFRRRLTMRATTTTVLIGLSYVVTLAVSIR
jgi:hypothetical protein